MQILTDDATHTFQILDVDFLEMVLLTDALTELSLAQNKLPVADMACLCVRAVELACQAERKRNS